MRKKIIWDDFRHGFRFPFLLATFGVIVCLCFDSLGTLEMTINNPLIYRENSIICVQYFYFNAVSFGGVFSNYFIAILAAVPFAACYSIEQKNHVVIYKIARCSRSTYFTSKILVAALCGGATLFLGSLLFIIALSTYMPLIVPAKLLEMVGLPYYNALAFGNGFSYFAVVLFLAFLSGALWGSIGMCVSAFMPNPYVAVCAPFIFKFLLVEIGRILRIPAGLRIDLILNARSSIVSDTVTLFVALLAVIALISLCYKLFSQRVERRFDETA